jgi:hypothetical protein
MSRVILIESLIKVLFTINTSDSDRYQIFNTAPFIIQIQAWTISHSSFVSNDKWAFEENSLRD